MVFSFMHDAVRCCDQRYPHPEGGSWLKLVYVPASCTHKCQPADVGLVVAVKAGECER